MILKDLNLKKPEYSYSIYTVNNTYIIVLEYTKTRIYGKYTNFFESEDLRF